MRLIVTVCFCLMLAACGRQKENPPLEEKAKSPASVNPLPEPGLPVDAVILPKTGENEEKSGDVVLAKMTGSCEITAPGDTAPGQGIEGKAYPFGSKIVTGAKSSVLLKLSGTGECQLANDTVLMLGSDLSVLSVHKGQVDISVKDNSTSIIAEGTGAKCTLAEGKISIKISREHLLTAAGITCESGKVSIDGLYYAIPSMDAGCSILLTASEDSEFQRLKIVNGSVDVEITGSDGKPKILNAQAGSSVKIWARKRTEDSELSVSTIYANIDGTLIDAFNYTTKDVK